MRRVIHLIAHTHWDREWYLPLGGFRARLVAALDDLIDRWAEDPGFPPFLLDGQTALLEDYLTVRPERRARVADLVAAGRLQTGPWYILADEQIPAGESLLRNLALGRADTLALGRRVGVAYSPDAFGHPAALPAVAREFGLPTAVLWRGLDPGRAGGRDLVWWAAPDGRRVLVYHLPPEGYEIGSNLLVPDVELAGAWRRVAARVLPRAATRHVAVFVGADHHAADPALAALASRLAGVEPALEFRFSRLEEFFLAAAAEAGALPTLGGELRHTGGYTWSLQGTHGTRAPYKRRLARAELLLTRGVEPLLATGPRPAAGERAVLARAWREVVQGQFHDVLCGTCGDEVTRAALARLDDAEAAGEELRRLLLNRRAGHDPDLAREGTATQPRVLLWNGAARPRGGVVLGEATFFRRDVPVGPPGARRARRGRGFAPFALRDESGLLLAPQLLAVEPGLERRDAARHYPDQDEVDVVKFAVPLAGAVGGLSSRRLDVVPSRAVPEEAFAAQHRRVLWNGRVGAEVEPAGTLLLEHPAAGVILPGLLQLEGERDGGDSYTFAPVRGDRVRRPSGAARVRATATGPLVAGMEWGVSLRGGTGPGGGVGRVAVRFRLELVGDSAALGLELELDNQARDHRLRLRFPTGLRHAAALAGAQFGVVARRPVRRARGRGLEQAVPTAPAHRWVAAARGSRGLALFAPGFFEYEWTAEGDLLLTLLRSVGALSRGDLAPRPGHGGWPRAIPGAQCPGTERIRLGLAPVTEAELAAPGRLEAMWEELFLPVECHWLRDATALPPEAGSAIELSGDGLVFSAALPGAAPGEILLRCYNLCPVPVAGSWRLDRPVRRARRVRADGTPLAELALGDGGMVVPFIAEGRGIVTIAVSWAE